MTTVTITKKKEEKKSSWWLASLSPVSLVINMVFIPFSLLHFKSPSWIGFGSNLIIDFEIKRSQKRRLCSTGRIELLELWGFVEGTNSTNENHMVVCREVPVPRDFSCKLRRGWNNWCCSERKKCDPTLCHMRNSSRDVLMSTDETLVEPCVRQVQHWTLQLLKRI